MSLGEPNLINEKATEAVLMELRQVIDLAGGNTKLISQLLDQINNEHEATASNPTEDGGTVASVQPEITPGQDTVSKGPEEGVEGDDVWTGIDTSRFYPRKSSNIGFLAEGETLKDVILQDRETCARLGTSPREIGEKIEAIINDAIAQLNSIHERTGSYPDQSKYVFIGDNNFKYQSYRGGQECPFEGDSDKYGSLDVQIGIGDPKEGEYFAAPGLIAHLLTRHDFFEGHTSYRVDPEKAARVLQLGIFSRKDKGTVEGSK